MSKNKRNKNKLYVRYNNFALIMTICIIEYTNTIVNYNLINV